MTITLTPTGGDPIALPPDLVWQDELTWSPVAQTTERSITGALIVDAAARVGGRAITLRGDGDSAWITRETLKAVHALADTPGQRMQLDVRGEAFTVLFDHGSDEESRALAMESVVDYADKEDDDYYCSLVLRFITE